MSRRFHIDDTLAAEVCRELGTDLPTTLAQVDHLYVRWCETIGFDCVSKAVALVDGVDPPGAEPTDLIERWLATGLGGTCWAHCSAFSAVLASAGIETSVALERTLADDRVDFHCFVVMASDRGPLAFDLVHLTDGGLPLGAGVSSDLAFYQSGFEADGDRLLHRYRHPGRAGCYAVLSTTLDADDLRSFCEVSATHSGVAARRFFSRRGGPTAMSGVKPNADASGATVTTWRGADDATLEDVSDPEAFLGRLGYHGDATALLERSGLVSFEGGTLRFAVRAAGGLRGEDSNLQASGTKNRRSAN